ncbi:MAG: single-stranded-DNA-specific exonuclease RecJ, partial [Bacteroidia bacterium]|nr:single-stranded-DNA-specific exonuclease RecJ [Bacteroidia bacterium]
IDFIICDHHKPGDNIPRATAVLNPKRPDCEYPFKELCGCGVGFKLIQALSAKHDETTADLTPLLDLVAIAIAADIVPITGENRTLAYFGLQVVNQIPRPGIQAILSQKKKPYYNTTDLVFIIAPRINAAGRMKHGQYAVDLLLENDADQATKMAQEIDGFNAERKTQDKEITKQALACIEDNEEQDDYSTVVYSPNWHKGVLGIVASRLIETYYRPTIVLTKSGDQITGSARSVKGFDIYDALDKCSGFLEQFGGHKYAAGMTLKAENYHKFKEAFEHVVKENIKDHQRVPELAIDLQIDLKHVSPRLFRILSQFGPFGPGNMRPVFMSSDLNDSGYARLVGEEGRHLKLSVEHGQTNGALNAIGFNLGKRFDLISDKKPFKAAFTIDENHWNGRTELQLKIRDIKPC